MNYDEPQTVEREVSKLAKAEAGAIGFDREKSIELLNLLQITMDNLPTIWYVLIVNQN